MSSRQPSGKTTVAEKVRNSVSEPPKFAVILLNDNYTTFDFVVKVLVGIFRKSVPESIQITNDVHRKGRGVCGVFTREIAETKIDMVEQLSKDEGYPLKCVLEKM
jgi:ATP-dependent Clp protease adaptor protein ClpS